MIGETISHYRVLEKLGSGGMGVVYAAEDLKLGRKVALKFLSNEYSSDPVALHRFEREARAASALNHPNICTIYEIDEFEGRRFMAMELLKGVTLKDCIVYETIPLDRLLDFSCQVLSGLEAAHSEGIIHRDIKPANIFVTVHGYVKLLDFGLAKLSAVHRGAMETAVGTTMAAEIVAREDLTMPGSAPGTIAYMSPEQALGEPLDGRTDLFSFGAVLYQMATRQLPFSGNTSAGTIDAILHKAPSPVVSLNPGMPRELQQVINKALEKDVHLRYQSAAELRTDLRRIRRDLQSSPSAAMSSESTETVPSPKPVAASSTTAAEKPSQHRRKFGRTIMVAAVLTVIVAAGLAGWWRVVSRKASAAQLRLQGLPGAQVFIDGRPAGSLGKDGMALMQVSPGQHWLQLSLQDYESYSTIVTLQRGQSDSVTAEMKAVAAKAPTPPLAAVGNLLVTSNVPGGDILVDGQLKGFTTSGKTASIELNEGSHDVQLQKAGYKDSPEQPVVIHAGQDSPVSFKLQASDAAAPAASYLIIKSRPGAEIRVDGTLSGTVGSNGAFPLKVDPGQHLVQASLPGYERYSSNVPVKASGKTYLVATLRASPPVVTTFTASQQKINAGETVKLNWTTQNATAVEIDSGIGSVSPTGTRDVSPTRTTSYVLTAKGSGGSTTARTSITVAPDPADVQAIDETMARFKGAYDSMDIGALRREWPSLTQTQSDALKTTFLGLASLRLNDDCPGSPSINVDTAEWTCNETISYAAKDKTPIPEVRNGIVFHFRRAGNRWYVDRRQNYQTLH
jgi:serine/threonine protein kinase